MKKTFSRLRSLRQIKNLSQAELARAAKISRPTISNFETGQISPGPELKRRLAMILGVPEAVLFPLEKDEDE